MEYWWFWEQFSHFGAKSALFCEFHEKVHFSDFLAKKRTFLTFSLKVHFLLQKATFGPKVRSGSPGSPRRGPGTAPEGSPEGRSPGPLRFRGGRESIGKQSKIPMSHISSGIPFINKTVLNSDPAGPPGDPAGALFAFWSKNVKSANFSEKVEILAFSAKKWDIHEF